MNGCFFKRAIVFLLLGATVTVAVAWGCSLWSFVWGVRGEGDTSFSENQVLIMVQWKRWGAISVHMDKETFESRVFDKFEKRASRIELPHWTDFSRPLRESRLGLSGREIRNAEGRGWPAYSLWYEIDDSHSRSVKGGIQVGTRHAPMQDDAVPRVLPLRVIVPGFFVDTLFYWAILWIPFVPPIWRRHLRIKRHQCQFCGYPIGISPACTECGKPVMARSAKTKA